MEITQRLEQQTPIDLESWLLSIFSKRSPQEISRVLGPKSNLSRLRLFLSKYSAIYGLLRAVKNSLGESKQPRLVPQSFDQAVSGLNPERLKYCSVFEGEDWRTIFTGKYRGRALHQSDPRIQAGVE